MVAGAFHDLYITNRLSAPMAAGKVISLRAKMRFLRRNGRQGEVLSGENESYTEYPLLKVRTLREKVRFIRQKR